MSRTGAGTRPALLQPEAAEQLGLLLGVSAGGTARRRAGLAEQINGESGLAQTLATTRALAAQVFADRGGVLMVERTEQVELIQFHAVRNCP